VNVDLIRERQHHDDPPQRFAPALQVIRVILLITRNQYASLPRGNAIPAGHVQNPFSDSYEIKFLCPGGIPRSVLLRPVYSDTTQLNSTDLLRADWLYAATGSVALPIAGDS